MHISSEALERLIDPAHRNPDTERRREATLARIGARLPLTPEQLQLGVQIVAPDMKLPREQVVQPPEGRQ